MRKYILSNVNSEIDFYIIYDNEGNTYEYHPDTQDVFVINRYEEDEGEKTKEDIVREIRSFVMEILEGRNDMKTIMVEIEIYDDSAVEDIEAALEFGLNNAGIDCTYNVKEIK